MSELSHDARELIAKARAAERADASAKSRVRAALAAHLGPPAPGPLPPAGSVAGSLGLSASKLVLICSLTAAGVVGTAALVKSRHAAAPGSGSRRTEERRPRVLAQPASAGPLAAPSSIAAPSTIAAPELARPSSPDPVRKISMRSPPPRLSQSGEGSAPVIAPAMAPKRTVASAVPEVRASTVSERVASAVPERPVANAVSVQPIVPESPSNLGTPSPSWRSSYLPTPVPDREVARITLAPKPSKECTAERELALLSGAQAALRAADGRRALHLLEQHAASCPSATFWQERSAARVLALCLLHRDPQALAEAAQLASLAPRSPLLARLRTSCAAAAVKP